jgi:hypothetical protein
MGRVGNGTLLTPLNLFANDDSGDEQTTNTKSNVANDSQRNVEQQRCENSICQGQRYWQPLESAQGEDNWDVPDPMLLGIKAGVNWSFRCDQKVLPACADGESEIDSEDDSEEAELTDYEYAEAVYDANYRPSIPTGLAICVNGSGVKVGVDSAEGMGDDIDGD